LRELNERVSEADRHLLQLVAAGDENGWRTLVSRFQQRLIAFSRQKLNSADRSSVAEDLVQETFVSFLKAIQTFRGECSLETFLFRILRFRLNDHFRKTGAASWVPGCEVANLQVIASDLSVSQHALRREQVQIVEYRLSNAIFALTNELKEQSKFRDLKIAEGLFFATLRNQQLAELMDVKENEIAVTKHRLLKRLRSSLIDVFDREGDGDDLESTFFPSLNQVWENQRPSCPKRTTLGKFSLELLPDDWTDFVHFHVNLLGCSYCRANLEELEDESGTTESRQFSQQLFQSTIGFLQRPD
jgi:RNA polymerase sigma factor (sigma-70 family)